jgi:hypothetical protein
MILGFAHRTLSAKDLDAAYIWLTQGADFNGRPSFWDIPKPTC